MKSIVTGGAGFIGSHIVDGLIARGDDVVVIDDLSEGRRENLKGAKARLVVASILNVNVLNREFKGADAVFHQAALRSVPKSLDEPLQYNHVNIDGTYNVLEAARKADVPRVVFASSSSVYGEGHPLPLKESYYPKPKSPYAATKLAGESYMSMFHELYGLKTISLRYFNVFGPRQPPNSQYSGVIPLFIKAAQNGKPPLIYGDGEQSRDFTYVSNIVKVNILASEAKRGFGEAFNVADGIAVTVNDLASKINSYLGKDVRPTYAPARPGDVLHTLAELDKSRDILGYVPDVMFDDGLKLTINSFKIPLRSKNFKTVDTKRV